MELTAVFSSLYAGQYFIDKSTGNAEIIIIKKTLFKHQLKGKIKKVKDCRSNKMCLLFQICFKLLVVASTPNEKKNKQ